MKNKIVEGVYSPRVLRHTPGAMDEKKITLAERLGMTAHISGLRHKARRLGLPALDDLANEAVARGCYHYAPSFDHGLESRVSERELPNDELAMALLTIANSCDPRIIRIGAMMLGAEKNDPQTQARLAVWERCECVVRYIATCRRKRKASSTGSPAPPPGRSRLSMKATRPAPADASSPAPTR